MTQSRRQFVCASGAAASLFVTAPRVAFGQVGEPYRIFIAFPPGGTSTASMNPMLPYLRKALGAEVELEYKPGAGGDLAAITVARSKPDGRSLLFGHAGPLAINPYLAVQSFYDPLKELVAIAQVVQFPIVLCSHTRHGVKTVDELVALGRKKELIVGSSGNGSIQHLSGELFKRTFGIETLHLPFLGGGPVQEALVKGVLDVLCETGSNVVKHIAEGRLTALAVMGKHRLVVMPDVPTFAELGKPELDVSAWFGLLAPSGTTEAELGQIEAAVLRALSNDDVQAALKAIGGIPAPLNRGEFTSFIASEHKRWGEVIRLGGLNSTGSPTTRGVGTPQ